MEAQVKGGTATLAVSTPLQCLDCSKFIGAAKTGVRCHNYPEGIPSEIKSSLCHGHEYRLRFR